VESRQRRSNSVGVCFSKFSTTRLSVSGNTSRQLQVMKLRIKRKTECDYPLPQLLPSLETSPYSKLPAILLNNSSSVVRGLKSNFVRTLLPQTRGPRCSETIDVQTMNTPSVNGDWIYGNTWQRKRPDVHKQRHQVCKVHELGEEGSRQNENSKAQESKKQHVKNQNLSYPTICSGELKAKASLPRFHFAAPRSACRYIHIDILIYKYSQWIN